ncbi:MAG: hypothetical protein ACFFCE_19495 [Promethearchaeota archaeon]
MNGKLTREENLRKIVEKRIFDKHQLVELKKLTQKVSTGEISARKLRETILEFREDILEKVLDIFEFYAHQTTTQNQLSEYASSNNPEITVDLQEKNGLLNEVASRIDKIYRKLKEKLEISR